MSIIGTVSTVKYCQIRRESDLTARLKEFFNDFCLFSEASEAFPEIFPDNSIRIISNYFELFRIISKVISKAREDILLRR